MDLGLLALGYHYVTVDCGWTLPDRTENGTITWNPARFPSGYPALGEFIHGLGLKFGVYGDAGIQMCMTGEPAQVGDLCMHETPIGENETLIFVSSRNYRCRDVCLMGSRFVEM